jgi:hypothetical protein
MRSWLVILSGLVSHCLAPSSPVLCSFRTIVFPLPTTRKCPSLSLASYPRNFLPSSPSATSTTRTPSYRSDISLPVVPTWTLRDLTELFANPTPSKFERCVRVGEQQTWPLLSRVSMHCGIEITLDHCIRVIRSRIAERNQRIAVELREQNAQKAQKAQKAGKAGTAGQAGKTGRAGRAGEGVEGDVDLPPTIGMVSARASGDSDMFFQRRSSDGAGGKGGEKGIGGGRGQYNRVLSFKSVLSSIDLQNTGSVSPSMSPGGGNRGGGRGPPDLLLSGRSPDGRHAARKALRHAKGDFSLNHQEWDGDEADGPETF